MKMSQIKKHIIQFLATVHLPRIKELKLGKIEGTYETDAGLAVQATVVSYIHIGLGKYQDIAQAVMFTMSESNDVISVCTTHDWRSEWESFWMAKRDSYLATAKAKVENILGEPWDDSDPTYLAALLLLLSVCIGPYAGILGKFTGESEEEIERIAARLYAARIWKDDSVDSELWTTPDGDVPFVMDSMVGAGHLVREWSEDQAAYSYSMTELGMQVKAHLNLENGNATADDERTTK